MLARVLWSEPAGEPAEPDASERGELGRREIETLQGLGYVGTQDMPTVAPAPALGAGVVIVRRLSDGGVSAFDRRLERELWRFDVEQGPVQSFRMPGLLAGGLFVFENLRELLALDERTGALEWRFALPDDDRIDLVPCAAGGRVFLGTEAGFVHALDLASGAPLWQAASDVTFGWSNPLVVDGRLVLADRGTGGRALSEVEAALLANLAQLGYVEQTPTPTGSELEPDVARLHAFDVRTGAELWKTALRGQRCSTPGVGRGFVVASFLDFLGRFDLATGALADSPRIQTAPYAFGSPTVVGDELLCGGPDGRLCVYDLGSGALEWAFHVDGAEVQDFLHTGDRIYVSTSRGLFALGDDPEQEARPPGFVLEAE